MSTELFDPDRWQEVPGFDLAKSVEVGVELPPATRVEDDLEHTGRIRQARGVRRRERLGKRHDAKLPADPEISQALAWISHRIPLQ